MRGGEEGFVEAAAVAQVVGGVVAGEVEDVGPEFGDGGWIGLLLWWWGGGRGGGEGVFRCGWGGGRERRRRVEEEVVEVDFRG